MANLYAITGTDPDDYSIDLSLLVSAGTPERAAELWLNYYWEEDPKDCPFETTVSPGMRPPRTEAMKVFRVKHDLYHEGALAWGEPNQMEYLGYLKEKS